MRRTFTLVAVLTLASSALGCNGDDPFLLVEQDASEPRYDGSLAGLVRAEGGTHVRIIVAGGTLGAPAPSDEDASGGSSTGSTSSSSGEQTIDMADRECFIVPGTGPLRISVFPSGATAEVRAELYDTDRCKGDYHLAETATVFVASPADGASSTASTATASTTTSTAANGGAGGGGAGSGGADEAATGSTADTSSSSGDTSSTDAASSTAAGGPGGAGGGGGA